MKHTDRYEEAEEAFKKAIEIDSKYAAPWNGLGNLLSDHTDRYEEAEEAFKKAIEIDPTYPFPFINLILFFRLIKKEDFPPEFESQVHQMLKEPNFVAKGDHHCMVLLGLAAFSQKRSVGKEILELLSKDNLRYDIRISCWLFSRMLNISDLFQSFPEPASGILPACNLEELIQHAATGWHLLDGQTQQQLKCRIQDMLTHFTPPKESRGLSAKVLTPALNLIGLEGLPDE